MVSVRTYRTNRKDTHTHTRHANKHTDKQQMTPGVCRSYKNGTCTKTFPRKKEKRKMAAWNISKKIAQPCMHVK